MIFRQFGHNTADYEKAWELRQRVLRAPLGLALAAEEREAEKLHLHFGLYDDTENLLACVSAVPQPDGSAKIRQMAVDPDAQGRGLGGRLMMLMELALSKQGHTELHMHARTSARGFYEKLGYHAVGTEFDEVTVPHIKMRKSL